MKDFHFLTHELKQRKTFSQWLVAVLNIVKPSLHIIRNHLKYSLGTCFPSLPDMAWPPYRCNDYYLLAGCEGREILSPRF